MSDISDDYIYQLILHAQVGDQDSVASLYEIYVDRIYRYIAYRVPTHEAEDLTAEVFIRMVSGLPKYVVTGAPFESWLYRIAAARIADYHRKAPQPEEEIDEHISDDTMQPEEFMLVSEEFKDVREALKVLSEDEQDLLILRFVERKSHKEVAEILEKSVAAVRTMQHRALHRLAEALHAEGKERHYLRGEDQPDSQGSGE